MDPDRYLIVLPTYDERENLPRMVEALEAVRARMPFAGEVLVVDDNSPDGTGRLADDLAGGYAFQIELTYRTLRMGGRVVELPITFVDRAYGESKMSRAIVLEAVHQVPALRLRALRGRLAEGADGEPRISLIP